MKTPFCGYVRAGQLLFSSLLPILLLFLLVVFWGQGLGLVGVRTLRCSSEGPGAA